MNSPPKLIHTIRDRVGGTVITARIYINGWNVKHHFSAELWLGNKLEATFQDDSYGDLYDYMLRLIEDEDDILTDEANGYMPQMASPRFSCRAVAPRA